MAPHNNSAINCHGIHKWFRFPSTVEKRRVYDETRQTNNVYWYKTSLLSEHSGDPGKWGSWR